MKTVGKLFFVLGLVLMAAWGYVDQGRPFWTRAMALETSTWPAALGDKTLRGVPLYVRCSLNGPCRTAVIKHEAKYPLPKLRWWGFIPAVLLTIAGAALSSPTPQKKKYTARWATRRDYRRLLTRFPTEDGSAILLASTGRKQDEFLAIRPGLAGRPEAGHLLGTGPSRAGKTLALIANLVNYQNSVIVLDVKGELHRLTSGYRRTLGRVIVLDPTGAGDQFDPYPHLARNPEEMGAAALRMMRADEDSEKIFGQRAAAGVEAMMWAAQIQRIPTSQFIARQIRGKGLPEFIESMRRIQDPRVQEPLVAFVGTNPFEVELDNITDRFLMSSWSTMVTRLAPFMTDGVLQMTSANSFSVQSLVNKDEPVTIYLQFNERSLEITRGVFGLIVSGLMAGLMAYVDAADKAEAEKEKKTPKVPVLLIIDEGGAVPMPNLPKLMAMVASRGVSIMLYVQSLAQLVAAYGQEGATTIKTNAHHNIFHPPRSLETAKEISELGGLISLDDERVSEQMGGTGNTRQSVTHGERERPLITVDEARQLPNGTVLVMSDELPFIRASRIEHWKNPVMTERLALPPTAIRPAPKRVVESLVAPPASTPAPVKPSGKVPDEESTPPKNPIENPPRRKPSKREELAKPAVSYVDID